MIAYSGVSRHLNMQKIAITTRDWLMTGAVFVVGGATLKWAVFIISNVK